MWLWERNCSGNTLRLLNIPSSSLHIGWVIFQFQITPFLVYAFVSLQMVAYYGNYSTIMDKLFLLVNNLLGSTEASVGNLIAEGNAEKIRKVFNELFSLRMLIAGTICFTLYQLLEPFITLWLGAGYILPGKS